MKWIWLQKLKLSVGEITPMMTTMMMMMTMMTTMMMMMVKWMMMIPFLCGRAAAAGKRLRHLGINLRHEFCTIIYDDHGDGDEGDDDRGDDNEDNDDDNHDNDSYNHVCADEMMLIDSIGHRYEEVQSKKRPGGII